MGRCLCPVGRAAGLVSGQALVLHSVPKARHASFASAVVPSTTHLSLLEWMHRGKVLRKVRSWLNYRKRLSCKKKRAPITRPMKHNRTEKSLAWRAMKHNRLDTTLACQWRGPVVVLAGLFQEKICPQKLYCTCCNLHMRKSGKLSYIKNQ